MLRRSALRRAIRLCRPIHLLRRPALLLRCPIRLLLRRPALLLRCPIHRLRRPALLLRRTIRLLLRRSALLRCPIHLLRRSALLLRRPIHLLLRSGLLLLRPRGWLLPRRTPMILLCSSGSAILPVLWRPILRHCGKTHC
jgi:hypothetical protein